jgi:hypothetical protein
VRPTGAVNPVSVLLVIAGAGAIYYAVMFGPLYIDNMSVKQAAEVGLTAGRGPEESIRDVVLRTINTGPEAVGTHMEEDAEGNLVEKRGLGLTEENVSVFKDEAAKTVRISIDYSRTVRLKPTQKTRTVSLHAEKEGPIP